MALPAIAATVGKKVAKSAVKAGAKKVQRKEEEDQKSFRH